MDCPQADETNTSIARSVAHRREPVPIESDVDLEVSPPTLSSLCDLEGVLEDVRTDLAARIEATDAEVDTEPLPRLVGDASQLRQLLQNLLENAITYAGEERPRIEITAERSGDEWVISVADEGIGIPPEKQESVFEVFNRLHSREEYEGTGLGLALCRRIIERHGGEMWVDSELGEGATFSFTLPVAHDHDT